MADTKKYSGLEAAKDIAGGSLSNLESLARGSVAGLVGFPGDINELVRDVVGFNPFPNAPALPSSTDILKAVPRLTKSRPESEGFETLGTFVQPDAAYKGAVAGATAVGKGVGRAAKAAAPTAAQMASELYGRAVESGLAMPTKLEVVKPAGGQWLTGYGWSKNVIDFPYMRRVDPREIESSEKLIADLKAKKAVEADPERLAVMDESLQLLEQGLERQKKNLALERWGDVNLQNYARQLMGTPDDPVLKMVEEWPQKKAEMLAERQARLEELNARKESIKTMPVPADVRDPDAWRQARARSVNEKIDQVNDDIDRINEYRPLHIPTERALFTETAEARERAGFPREGTAKTELGRAWENLTDSMIHSIEAGKLRDPEYMQNLQRRNMESRLGTASAEPMSLQDIYEAKRFGRYGEPSELKEMLRRDPWLLKVDPSTPIYKLDLQFGGGRPEARSLGFDHVMDVLRADVQAGRIRPEQLSKMSVEQAVRRTAEYDAEKAVQMKKATAEEVKNLTVAKEFEDGVKIVQLDKPGQFAKESQRMGHSVEGYEPPQGHADWSEGSGEVGSERYGHGGWDAIKSGDAQVFSIRDEKNMPHVTIEVASPSPYPLSGDKLMGMFGKRGAEAWNKFNTSEKEFNLSDFLKNNYPDIWEGLTSGPKRITQIKGRRNEEPDEDYLPYVQKFIREGNYEIAGDLKNSGLIDTSTARSWDHGFPDKYVSLRDALPANAPRYVTENELEYVRQTGKFEPMFKHGGDVRMADGGIAPYGLRHGSPDPKGKGYFGPMRTPEGDVMTELSAEDNRGEFPLIVPTLTREELEYLIAGGEPTDTIYRKASEWAETRRARGQTPFATGQDLRMPKPMAKGGRVGVVSEALKAIKGAAEAAGAKPQLATKPLTTLQDTHTNLMDSVRERAAQMQRTMEGFNYKYKPGEHVFTESKSKKPLPPWKIVDRQLSGNMVMREPVPPGTPALMGKIVRDPETGKPLRTPYEPGYKVRREYGPDDWEETIIPESGILGRLDPEEPYKKGGEVIKKVVDAVRKVAENLPPPEAAQKTQIKGTLGTYKKAGAILDGLRPGGTTLDYGSGLGHGASHLGADSFEPFPRKDIQPTYRNPTDIPDEAYDRVTNFSVLNVLPKAARDEAVKHIGRVLKKDGVALVTARNPADVMSASGELGPEAGSLVTSIGTYQKGFTTSELQDYIKKTLGEGFEVKPMSSLSGSGVMIRKVK